MEQNDKILLLLAYVAGMSLISFILMGIDKHRARKKAWRISERTLFLVAICGGGIGGTLGMWVFRHKTRHWYFQYGFPLLAMIQILLIAIFIWLWRI